MYGRVRTLSRLNLLSLVAQQKKNSSPLNTKRTYCFAVVTIGGRRTIFGRFYTKFACDGTMLGQMFGGCMNACAQCICSHQQKSWRDVEIAGVWARYAYEMCVYILCEPGLIKPHTFNVCVIFTHSFSVYRAHLHRLLLQNIWLRTYLFVCLCSCIFAAVLLVRSFVSFDDSKACTLVNVHLHLAAAATMQ